MSLKHETEAKFEEFLKTKTGKDLMKIACSRYEIPENMFKEVIRLYYSQGFADGLRSASQSAKRFIKNRRDACHGD